jgi:hypothetical protein
MCDVTALLAARQLVPVERRADELLVRVETLPLPPHVARTLEHLLERDLPHLDRADEGFNDDKWILFTERQRANS